MKGTITLNIKEQRTNDILVKLINKEIKIKDASVLLGLCERQVYRLKQNYLTDGIKSIPHINKLVPTKKGCNKDFKDNIIKSRVASAIYLDS